MKLLKCLYSKLEQWFNAFNVDFEQPFVFLGDFCLFDDCWGLLFSKGIELASTEKLKIFTTFNFYLYHVIG